jgi:hypothetical protein
LFDSRRVRWTATDASTVHDITYDLLRSLRLTTVSGNPGSTESQVTSPTRWRSARPRLYHYSSSKEELSLRCVHKSAAEVCAWLRAIAAAELAPGDKLRALFREQALIEVREYRQYLQLAGRRTGRRKYRQARGFVSCER